MSELITKLVGGALLVVVVVAGVAALIAFPLSWAWNYVIPELFGLPRIGAMQAFCLSFVSGSLIKSSLSTNK